jgi:hypothetical protein
MDAKFAIEIAETMLEKSLKDSENSWDQELVRRIKRIHDLVLKIKPGSDLCSSQSVASIIEAWEREKERLESYTAVNISYDLQKIDESNSS